MGLQKLQNFFSCNLHYEFSDVPTLVAENVFPCVPICTPQPINASILPWNSPRNLRHTAEELTEMTETSSRCSIFSDSRPSILLPIVRVPSKCHGSKTA